MGADERDALLDTLRGERHFEKKDETDNYHRVERAYGSFTRSFTLPNTVSAEGGAAVIHCDAKITAREAVHGLADGALDIIAIATETAQAMFLAGTYGGSSKRLKGLTWGAEDLSVELGAEANRDREGHFLAPYQLARSLCLAGAAAAQVQAIDTVYIDFRNETGLRRECEEARRDGFTGKMAIHPGQVAAINEVFTPTAEAIKRAEAVIAAFADNPGAGTVGIGGVMYDRPHLARDGIRNRFSPCSAACKRGDRERDSAGSPPARSSQANHNSPGERR